MLAVLILPLLCSGCGSNLENILVQSITAAGRTALDIWLTELANDLADSLNDNADNANGNDNDNGNDNGGNGNGNDNGNGGGLDDLTGDATAGAEIYDSAGCAPCHCADASGNCALSAPSIVGADRHTLDDFLRGDASHPSKPALSDQEIVDLEAYLASFDEGGGGGEPTGDPVAGEAIYADNGCAGCHCADATGGCALSAPSLIGVDFATLDDVLRGDATHPIKVDLTDDELADLEAFLADTGG